MDDIDILRAYCVIHNLHFVNVQENPDFQGDPEWEDTVAAGFAGMSPPDFVIGLTAAGSFVVAERHDPEACDSEFVTYTREQFLDRLKLHDR